MKNELLLRAASANASLAAELAVRGLSDDALTTRMAVLSKSIRKYDRASLVIHWAGAGAVFLALLQVITSPGSVAAGMPLAIAVMMSAAGAMLSRIPLKILEVFISPAHEYGAELKLISPLKASACPEALRLLEEGGPAVPQWRDLAIAERDELRMFDLAIMRALHNAYQQEQFELSAKASALAREAQLRLVCQKVHGLHENMAA